MLKLPLKTLKNKSKSTADKVIKRYYCEFNIFKSEIFKKVFAAPKWVEMSREELMKARYVDLLFLDGWDMFKKEFWHIKSLWKNRVSAPLIINKYLLHRQFKGADFIPETHLITTQPPQSISFDKHPWIWRNDNPVGGGTGVCVLTSYDELLNAIRQFNKERNKGVRSAGQNALISRYITNPMMIVHGDSGDKYKFHIRIYYIVVFADSAVGVSRCGVYRNGEIALAQMPYVDGDFKNTKIHDTHLKYGNSKLFPANYPSNPQQTFDQIVGILRTITGYTLKTAKKYDESLVNFQIFGCDFMVDMAGKVYLIEINNSPDYDTENSAATRANQLQLYILNGIQEFVIGYAPNVNNIVMLL